MTQPQQHPTDAELVRERAERWLTESLEPMSRVPPESPSHLPPGFLTHYRDVLLPDLSRILAENERLAQELERCRQR